MWQFFKKLFGTVRKIRTEKQFENFLDSRFAFLINQFYNKKIIKQL